MAIVKLNPAKLNSYLFADQTHFPHGVAKQGFSKEELGSKFRTGKQRREVLTKTSQLPSLAGICRTHIRSRYHGGRRPSSDDSFHSPTGIPPSALDKPSIMKRYHRRPTCSHISPRRSLTMVTLHDRSRPAFIYHRR